MSNQFVKPEFRPDMNPVDYFNLYKCEALAEMLAAKFKELAQIEPTKLVMQGFEMSISSHAVTVSASWQGIHPSMVYTPFMVYAKIFHGDNWTSASNYISHRYLNAHIPFIRVGVDYYKVIESVDIYGIKRKELKTWTRATILDDNDKKFLASIPKFDTFVNWPSNTDYQQIVNGMYNIYREFVHKPVKGEWTWTKRLLEHIFGEQYELGIKYMQMLYQHPDRYAPILVLASKKRGTGKTTFLNWLNQIYGDNCAVITADDITSAFNASYAHANIIAVEETINDRKEVVEKLKSMSAGKFITMNRKFIDGSKIAFFGHFIITSNNPKEFLKIDEDEIRFWVRKVAMPQYKNTNIEADLLKEIPAFIDYLNSLPALDWSHSRMMFEANELNTEALQEAVEASRPGLYKDLKILFEGHFSENSDKDYVFTAERLKDRWFRNNSSIGVSYIEKILKEEFKIKRATWYLKGINGQAGSPTNCYKILRSDYVGADITGEGEQEMPF